MKKLIIIFTIALSLTIGSTVNAALNLGQDVATNAAKQAGYNSGTNRTSFASIIGLVIQMALALVGVIFLCFMIYAGYLWMTAQGEEEQVKKAQTIIKQSIIGLIIVVGAYSITYYIVPVLVNMGSTGTGAVNQPSL